MAFIIEAIYSNIIVAASKIKKNELVAFPTETVYGLGANALSSGGVEKIFKLKNRPSYNPLIIHFGNLKEIEDYFYLSTIEKIIAKTFWPGPLTLILNKPKKLALNISALCKGNVPSFAVRIPNNHVALQLIQAAGCPLAAPSANIANCLSPTTAKHVEFSFPNSDLLILDGGKTVLGLESTILEVSDNNINILRFGCITQELLENCLQLNISNNLDNTLKSPGQFNKHYSPKTPLRLNAIEVYNGEALLAFGSTSIIKNNTLKNAKMVLNLSNGSNLNEAANNLFEMLWQLDLGNYKSIAVMPIPNIEVGKAINERLSKAAAKLA